MSFSHTLRTVHTRLGRGLSRTRRSLADRLYRLRRAAEGERPMGLEPPENRQMLSTTPLLNLGMNENSGSNLSNIGSTGGIYVRSSPTPAWTTNTPVDVGGTSALDFGTSSGNYAV
jgi:hypothetical protein